MIGAMSADPPPTLVRAIVTTGWRARVRLAVRLAVIAALVLGAIGLVVEDHAPCRIAYHPAQPHVWGEPRAITEDLTPRPFVLLALAVVLQLVAHRRRLVASIVAGPVAAAAALSALLAIVWIHARAHTITGVSLAAPALLAAAALGLSQLLVEPWLALAERRARR